VSTTRVPATAAAPAAPAAPDTRASGAPSRTRAAAPSARAVLVTGASRYLGARLVNALQSEPGIRRVIGVDTTAPTAPLGRAEFVRADIRDTTVGEIISSAEVDTVVHLNLVTAATGGRPAVKEINVIGTMQLLAACQRSARLRRLVVRSSAAVYGCSAGDPAVFGEDDQPVDPPRSGYARDVVEVEDYVRGLARRRPDLSVSTLRFASFLGPSVDSPLTRYFLSPLVPTVLGFDPRLQFVHEDDGVEVLRRMTTEDHPGTYNVAGDGVLLLSQAVRRAGRTAVPLPQPALRGAGGLGRRFGMSAAVPDDLLGLIRYGRVVDTSRLAADLAWRPKYGSAAAFADFVRARGRGPGRQLELFDQLTEGIHAVRAASRAGEAGGR
jgi:UDP-glucose 4-epimerase